MRRTALILVLFFVSHWGAAQVLENYQASHAAESNDAEAMDLKYSAAKGIYDGKKFDKAIPALKDFVTKVISDQHLSRNHDCDFVLKSMVLKTTFISSLNF